MASPKTLLIVLCVALHASHLAVRRIELPQPASLKESLPSAESLRLLSLGYRNLAADYYWLRSVNHFGDIAMHRAGYPNLEQLIRRVLALDPYFVSGYIFAGTTLTVKGLDPNISVEILEQGMRYRQDAWQIPFLLGFNAFYFAHDYDKAARALAVAAALPGAPEIAGPLATRLAAEAGEPELGLQLIDSLIDQLSDQSLIDTYSERRNLLQLEEYLQWLNAAADHYREQLGHSPKTLSDLVAAGFLKKIPPEPAGGRFFIDAEGVVQTTSTRLRLNRGAQ